MSVKRYDFTGDDMAKYGLGPIVECHKGDCVSFSDHAAEVAKLQARLDVLAQAVRAWKWHVELGLSGVLEHPWDAAWVESYRTLAFVMDWALEVIDGD